MTIKKILVTGGAGFVGTHLVKKLLEEGFKVRVMDNLDPQVHGGRKTPPKELPRNADFMRGDVTNPKAVEKALKDMDAVFHLAAAVGVGQSMYQIRHYVNVNSMGGATLLEGVLKHRKKIKKMIVASSMSIYGEGAYRCPKCGFVYPTLRSEDQLSEKKWNPACPQCHSELSSVPTPESKPLYPTSIYAVTKRDHEENFLAVGCSYKIPTVALRFFNIYGPNQALSNPYTGVAAIFSSRLLNNNSPLIFEDGHQSRDFIHVNDIVQGCVLSLRNPKADYQVFNVGTGKSTSVLQMAELLQSRLNVSVKPKILQTFRAGDIRHCYGDITKIRTMLGYHPQIDLEKGVGDLISWVATQTGHDRVGAAMTELKQMGLVR